MERGRAIDMMSSRSYVVKSNTVDGARAAQEAFLNWISAGLIPSKDDDRGVAYLSRNTVDALKVLGYITDENPNADKYFSGIDLYHVTGNINPKLNENLKVHDTFKPRKVAALSALNPTDIIKEIDSPRRHMLLGPGVVECMRSGVGMNQTVRVLSTLADYASTGDRVLYVIMNPAAFPSHEAEMLVTAPQLEPLQV